eukprot:symbB.v1.2.020260.t1/scaffold1696.1/size105557/2
MAAKAAQCHNHDDPPLLSLLRVCSGSCRMRNLETPFSSIIQAMAFCCHMAWELKIDSYRFHSLASETESERIWMNLDEFGVGTFESCLVPIDYGAMASPANDLGSGYRLISLMDVSLALAKLPAGCHATVVLDCCHSTLPGLGV